MTIDIHLPAVQSVVSLGTLIADVVGVFVGAWAGTSKAGRAGFDMVGFMILGTVSGVGGGVIRDLMLQAGPPLALVRPGYLAAAFAGAAAGFFISLEGKRHERLIIWLNSLTLGLFAVAATQRTLDVGLSALAALTLGVVASVGGGMVRDILLRETAGVLKPGPFVAIPALVASCLALFLTRAGYRHLALAAGAVVGAAIHLLSRRYEWRLPTRSA
jgi:uncharacterized membrane protein YeiH